jgi:hypothetical protein
MRPAPPQVARLCLACLAAATFAAPLFLATMDLAAALGVPAFYVAFVAAPPALLLRPCQLAWQRAEKRHSSQVGAAMALVLHTAGIIISAGLLVVFCSAAARGVALQGVAEVTATLLPVGIVCWVAGSREVVRSHWAPAAAGLYVVALLLATLLRGVLHLS